MNIKLNDSLFREYNLCKLKLLKKIAKGYRASMISNLKKQGFTDDDIFIVELIGTYKSFDWMEAGYIGNLLRHADWNDVVDHIEKDDEER